MYSFFLKIFEWMGQIVSLAIPPIKIELHSFRFDNFDNQIGDAVFIITPYPQRYYCKLSLTNRRTTRSVYIKEVYVEVAKEIFRESGDANNMKLEPQERKTMNLIFPVEKTHRHLVNSRFSISVLPAIGRPSKASGVLVG